MMKTIDTTFRSSKMKKNTASRTMAAAIVLSGMVGCGTGLQQAASVSGPTPGVALHGNVHGGQQPVAGSSVQLYAAGSTGYGSAYPYTTGTSLLGTNVVTSDAGGNFSLTNDYACPSLTTEVYIVATGGNPGLKSGTNPNLALMAALGPCGQLSSSTVTTVNELTTVAAVWALSPFMTGIANIGTSAGNTQGLTNAFAAINELVNVSNGTITGPTLPTGATLPIAKINTLADILASCINSAGGTAGDSSLCGTLFAATTVGSVAPTDTINAALNIAHHPAVQTSALFGLSSSSVPFQPVLAATPNDFTIGITYKGSGISKPKGVAIDANANVWIANSGGNSVTKLDNTGAALSGISGFTQSMNAPSAIAIDASGNAWVVNAGGSTVSALTPIGGMLSNSPFTVGTAPSSLAFDALGNVWVANAGSNSVTELNGSGTFVQAVSSGVNAPGAVAVSPK